MDETAVGLPPRRRTGAQPSSTESAAFGSNERRWALTPPRLVLLGRRGRGRQAARRRAAQVLPHPALERLPAQTAAAAGGAAAAVLRLARRVGGGGGGSSGGGGGGWLGRVSGARPCAQNTKHDFCEHSLQQSNNKKTGIKETQGWQFSHLPRRRGGRAIRPAQTAPHSPTTAGA